MTEQSRQRDFFLVFVDGKPEHEAEYAEWFCGPHRKDMMSLPEVSAAHMFTTKALDGLPEPSRLCAIYETPDGIALLDAIGKAKGTDRLPENPDQGAMSWRLFNCENASDSILPCDARFLLWLLPGEPDGENIPDISLGAEDWAVARLSPAQSRKGREYGRAVIIALPASDHAEKILERFKKELEPAGARCLLLHPCPG